MEFTFSFRKIFLTMLLIVPNIRKIFLTMLFIGPILLLSLYINTQWKTTYSKYGFCSCNQSANTQSNTCLTNETSIESDGMWTVMSVFRLGNEMNGYAALYALAKMHGKQPYIQPKMHGYLAPLFKITLPVLNDAVEKKIKWREYSLKNWMLEEYKHLSGKYVRLLSSPFSWTFHYHVRDQIRREFTIHDFISESANEQLLKMKGTRKNVTFVGVHVRRGDYVVHMPRDWKGVIGDKAYLDKAMGYFRKKYKESIFVVASNGMPWCKENIDASKGDVFFAGDSVESSPGNDFGLLVHCNHTIFTIGSFGWWAAYLAGGEAIYLSNYTGPGSTLPRHFFYETTYLPDWIGIAADLTPLINDTWRTKGL